MNVEQNIEFGLKLRKIAKSDRNMIIDAVMGKLDIETCRGCFPAQMSDGQQQRVALARMLVLKPKIILLDEPLSNLDARLRLEMRSELENMHEQTCATLVFVTHDQRETMTLATAIAVMRDGKLQQVGSSDDIYERPQNRFVAEFIGTPPINIIELANDNAASIAAWLRKVLQNCKTGYPQHGSAGIRPEKVRLASSSMPNGCPAEIFDIMSTGGSWIVELLADQEKFLVSLTDMPAGKRGDKIWFHVECQHIHLFDREGKRVES